MLATAIRRELGAAPDFESSGPLRYTHRRTAARVIHFVANRSDQPVSATATFRTDEGASIASPISTGRES
jgi:hypothetical protein